MTTVTIIRVDVSGASDVHSVEPTLAALQNLVGETIETIGPAPSESVRWAGYCDKKRQLKDLPANHVATVIAVAFGWEPPPGYVLRGPVVFAAATEREHVPSQILAAADTLTRLDTSRKAA